MEETQKKKVRRKYTENEETFVYSSFDAKQKRRYQEIRKKNHSDAKSITAVIGKNWFYRDGTSKGNKGGNRRKIKNVKKK